MKKIIISISILFLFIVNIYSNVSAIIPYNLPQDKEFQNSLNYFINNIRYMDHFTAEWKYQIDKNKLINEITLFETEVKKQINNNSTYDLQLLHIIIMSYLYNLDIIEYSDKIDYEVNILKEKYPQEYRTYWIYGNYLINSARPIEGISQFLYVIDIIKELKLFHPAFLEDYAYACLMNLMLKNGIKAIEIAAEIYNESVETFRIYNIMKGLLKTIDIENDYSEEQTWFVNDYHNNYRIISRMIGASIPLAEKWLLEYTGLQNKKAIIKIISEEIINNGKSYKYNIIFKFNFDNLNIDDYCAIIEKKYKILDKTDIEINGIKYVLYTYEYILDDNEIIGYYLVSLIIKNSDSGLGVELPFNIEITKNIVGKIENAGVYFIPIENQFDTIYKNMIVEIIFETNKEILIISSEIFWELIKNTIIE